MIKGINFHTCMYICDVITKIEFGSGTKSILGPGAKFNLVPDPSSIWSQTQIQFGPEPKSNLGRDLDFEKGV